MIGLDTNAVIRYLAQDDEKQSALASRFIENKLTADTPGYINHITLCEIAWVLQRCYAVGKPQLREILEGLLTTKQLLIEKVEIPWKALRIFEVGNADFSDALIAQANIGDGCEYTVTFDRQAAKLPGFHSLG